MTLVPESESTGRAATCSKNDVAAERPIHTVRSREEFRMFPNQLDLRWQTAILKTALNGS